MYDNLLLLFWKGLAPLCLVCWSLCLANVWSNRRQAHQTKGGLKFTCQNSLKMQLEHASSSFYSPQERALVHAILPLPLYSTKSKAWQLLKLSALSTHFTLWSCLVQVYLDLRLYLDTLTSYQSVDIDMVSLPSLQKYQQIYSRLQKRRRAKNKRLVFVILLNISVLIVSQWPKWLL